MQNKLLSLTLFSILSLSAHAENFTLTSPDIKPGSSLSNKYVFNGFGCTGDNKSPAFRWSDAPKNTKSFAFTVYDPDAPTGSGWWHWVVFNIPSNTNKIVENAGKDQQKGPKGSIQSRTDFGSTGFGGACPPKGEPKHRYQFTLYALDIEKLPLDKNSSGALVGFYIHNHTIKSSSIEVKYGR